MGAIILVWMLGLACDSPTEPLTPPPPTVPPELAATVTRVLADYDAVREILARGETEDLRDTARAVERSAGDARALAPAALQPNLGALSTAAARLAEAPAGDLTEARRGFGELSRHLIAVLAAEPSLAEGLDVHACDTALGYPKWVQGGRPRGSPYDDVPSAGCPRPADWAP